LAIRSLALRIRNKNNEINNDQYMEGLKELLNEWRKRYGASDKGEWTKFMIPNVKERYNLPMAMDH